MNRLLKSSPWVAFAFALSAFFGQPMEVRAQADLMWMDVGEYHYQYSSTGTEPSINQPQFRGLAKYWPGIYFREGGTHVRSRHYIGVRDFTDENGVPWTFKVARAGPRVFDLGEHFPLPMELVGKFPKPDVFVDGFQSFPRPTVLNRVDPSIPSDRMIIRGAHTTVGITWEEKIYGFSNPYHDDYHIREMTWTNTGNVDEDEEIELPDQTANEMMLSFAAKEHLNGPRGVTSAGVSGTMWDYVGDGKEDLGKWEGIRATLGWIGNGTNVSFLNRIGGPIWRDGRRSGVYRIADGDSIGRLGGAYILTRAILHADMSPTNRANDPGQPRSTGFHRGGEAISNPSFGDAEQMKDTYHFMHPDLSYAEYGHPGEDGHFYPHEADRSAPPPHDAPFSDEESWYERMAAQVNVDRMRSGGVVPWFAFGPYTLAPGESVNMVWIEGVHGLNRDVCVAVGRAYKDSGYDDTLPITYNGQTHTKNRWVLGSRDSIYQMIRRATANWESGYAVPHPPLPPSVFRVQSGSDQIVLSWETFPNADHTGFEIWRTRNLFESSVSDLWEYELIATLGAEAREYQDADVVRGISYFYYIQSVGQVNNDGTRMTPTGSVMKSSRYYTQTYDPAFLKRPPGSTLADVRVVPNPYILEADQNIRFPDQQDKLAFFEIPGECTIQIFSELGEAIYTIEHTDGTGDEFWNLTTESNQVLASGIYFAVIKDLQTGEKVIKKFAVIR